MFRFLLVGFAVLSVIYACVVIAERCRIRAKLVRAWRDAGCPGPKEEFVRSGMAEYQHSIRRKLLLAVFVVPVLLVLCTIYVVNFM